MSAKVVRTVPCAEGASPDSEPHSTTISLTPTTEVCGRGVS
jgi:hypothetical protein